MLLHSVAERGKVDAFEQELALPDPIVRKIAGHRSRELERYQHLTPRVRALTVNLIPTEFTPSAAGRKMAHSPICSTPS